MDNLSRLGDLSDPGLGVETKIWGHHANEWIPDRQSGALDGSSYSVF